MNCSSIFLYPIIFFKVLSLSLWVKQVFLSLQVRLFWYVPFELSFSFVLREELAHFPVRWFQTTDVSILKNWQLDIMASKTPKFFVLIVFWLYGISAFPWSINFWKHQNNLLINFFYALNQGLASVPVSKSEHLSRDSCCFNAIVP